MRSILTTVVMFSASEAFVRVVVIKSKTLELVSSIIGWTYFVAWSISFYPQIWDNYRRKRYESYTNM